MEMEREEVKVEEVKKIKYLGFIFKKNGGRDAQVRERVKKGAAIMEQVWNKKKEGLAMTWEEECGLFEVLI